MWGKQNKELTRMIDGGKLELTRGEMREFVVNDERERLYFHLPATACGR